MLIPNNTPPAEAGGVLFGIEEKRTKKDSLLSKAVFFGGEGGI